MLTFIGKIRKFLLAARNLADNVEVKAANINATTIKFNQFVGS